MNSFEWFIGMLEPIYWLIGIVVLTMGILASALLGPNNPETKNRISIRDREEHTNG